MAQRLCSKHVHPVQALNNLSTITRSSPSSTHLTLRQVLKTASIPTASLSSTMQRRKSSSAAHVRWRNQEVDFLGDEPDFAKERHPPNALLCQHQRGKLQRFSSAYRALEKPPSPQIPSAPSLAMMSMDGVRMVSSTSKADVTPNSSILSEEDEPAIFGTTRKFGTVLENIVMDENGVPDFTDTSKTQNTRGSYPIEFIDNRTPDSKGGHPQNVIFLTCDAFWRSSTNFSSHPRPSSLSLHFRLHCKGRRNRNRSERATSNILCVLW